MAYIRFAIPWRDSESGVDSGLLSVSYSLLETSLPEDQRLEIKEHLDWFRNHLPVPERFNRSSSKGHYRRASRGIAWFRDSASEHLAHMHALKRVVEKSGYVVTMICEGRIGYVVYEDEFQVIAEPFADTRTRAQ